MATKKTGRPREPDAKRRWPTYYLRVPPELLAEWRAKGGTQDDLRRMMRGWVRRQR